jgi:LacI family transcriptional regulator
MRDSKTTMADVARLAGVSASTAARVINGGYVSEENRARVRKAADALGYRPNAQARALRYSRSFSLGLILTSARMNPLFAHISHAIRRNASERGYSLLTVNHGFSVEDEAAGIRQFLDYRVEAVILCNALSVNNLNHLRDAGVPLIQIERRSLDDAPWVRIDPLPGMRAAVRHLVDLGHRRIGFVGGTRESMLQVGLQGEEEPLRVNAFLKAAEECGLGRADLSLSLGAYSYPSGQLAVSGRDLTRSLLDANAPTAIISGSDVLTAGLLQELYSRRLHVPQDISVISYDDSISGLFAPACTTIAQPIAEIGKAALDLIESRSDERAPTVTLHTSFIIRESTGPAPGPA